MHCPRSVQPLSLLQHTIFFSESYFNRALAKTWACHSALKPPGSFLSAHRTTMSTSLYSAEALLKSISCSIPLSLAAWTAPSTDSCSRSIADNIAAVGWCGMSGPTTREPRIASTWCRQFMGESGRKSDSSMARMDQHHQQNPRPNGLKVRVKEPRYDHSVALSVMQSLMNKLGGMSGESEEKVVERVNWELKGLGTFVSDKMLWKLVRDSNLAPALVPPVTAWAVSQPGWQDQQQLYINLIDHVGITEHKDATMAVCRLAMSSECVLDYFFLEKTSRYLIKWRLHKEVLELFTVLGQQGCKASHKLYTVLLGIFGQNRDLEGALNVLDSMKRIGISPDAHHYTVVLELCGKRRSVEQLERVVVEMRGAGIQPGNVTYTTLIHSYGLLYEPQRAGEVFKEMLRGGILPTAKTFGAYHAILTRGGWLKDAERLLDIVQKRTDLLRDAEYYRLLIDGFSTSLNADKLIEAHREMVRAGITLDIKIYRNVFHRLCDKCEAQLVYYQLFLEVLAQGRVELSNNIYSVVYRTLVRDGLAKEAERVRKQASNRGQATEALSGEMHNKIEDLLSGRKYGELKDVLREIRKEMGVVPFWVYLMLLSGGEGRWVDKEKEAMLEILDVCEYESTKIVRLLLDEKRDDSEVWVSAIKMLEGTWNIVGVEPRCIIMLLMSLLHSNGLYSRASRLWLESQDLKLTAPDWTGFKLIRERVSLWSSSLSSPKDTRETFALDLHTCTSRAANVVVSTELRHFKDFRVEHGHRMMQIITGKGKNSRIVGHSTVQRGVIQMLGNCRSPFVTNSRNLGVLEARMDKVQKWLQSARVKQTLELCGGEASHGK